MLKLLLFLLWDWWIHQLVLHMKFFNDSIGRMDIRPTLNFGGFGPLSPLAMLLQKCKDWLIYFGPLNVGFGLVVRIVGQKPLTMASTNFILFFITTKFCLQDMSWNEETTLKAFILTSKYSQSRKTSFFFIQRSSAPNLKILNWKLCTLCAFHQIIRCKLHKFQ